MTDPTPPPPEWRPLPGHGSGSPGAVGCASVCAVLGVLALILMLTFSNDVSECQSTLGQIGQALDNQAASGCGTAIALHEIAWVFLVIFSVGFAVSLLTHFSKR